MSAGRAVGATGTFVGPLTRAERVASERSAVVCDDERFTYAQLCGRARRLVGALRGLGLQGGDRVAVIGPNCHRYLELYLGVPAGGFVLVPLNARHTEHELRYALQDSGARVLFAPEHSRGLADVVERFVALPAEYERLIDDAREAPWADVEAHHLAGLFYTGGTTGAAKGVMLTHGNLVANALHFMASWSFTPETRWLVGAPMFHAAGTVAVLAMAWAGGEQVMLPAFDPAAALEAIERHGVTATLLVPTMVAALAEEQRARPRDAGSLRLLSHGGSPIATEVLRRAHEAFPQAELMHLYGATETAPILTVMAREEAVLDGPRARSCGQPAIGVELDIVDPGDQESLAVGEVGEVRVRGHNITPGYWNKPEETDRALAGGWYATGDLGYVDEEGYLFLVDRAKDMIVTGGENVYSTEVEDALFRHPAVREAAVFGVPHERWGEAVHAVVVPAGPCGEEELIEHCRALIADYKVPKHIELRQEALPKSGAGKVLKRELREPHWRDRESRVG